VWQGEWGSTGTGDGQFNHILGLAVAPSGAPNPGRIYAADYFNSRVQFFDADGEFLGILGTGPGSDPGELQNPVSVGVAPDGIVYVADASNHRIAYFTADGDYIGQWGVFVVSGVEVGDDGTVYVASRDNRVQLFTPTGTALGQFGSTGSGDGQFIDAGDLGLAPDSKTLYVADANNFRIQAFCVTVPPT
jgi:DNA-binding beta-propeller fold protein YncE